MYGLLTVSSLSIFDFVPCNGPIAQIETCILIVFSHWKAGMAGVCQQFSQSADR